MPPLSWNEIKARAVAFSRDWAEAKTFWNEFFLWKGMLLKAHQTLDKAVDTAYGKRDFKSEAERVAFLFDLHQKYIGLLPTTEKAKKPGRKRKTGT